jgi:hypothetical protein
MSLIYIHSTRTLSKVGREVDKEIHYKYNVEEHSRSVFLPVLCDVGNKKLLSEL